MTDKGTMVDAVGRARHSLQQLHDPGSASVTVHGTCPIADCRQMNVIDVRADTIVHLQRLRDRFRRVGLVGRAAVPAAC